MIEERVESGEEAVRVCIGVSFTFLRLLFSNPRDGGSENTSLAKEFSIVPGYASEKSVVREQEWKKQIRGESQEWRRQIKPWERREKGVVGRKGHR